MVSIHEVLKSLTSHFINFFFSYAAKHIDDFPLLHTKDRKHYLKMKQLCMCVHTHIYVLIGLV